MTFFFSLLLDDKMDEKILVYNKIRTCKELKRSILDPYSSMRSGIVSTLFFLPSIFFMIKNILWCLLVTILAIANLLQDEDLNRSTKNNFKIVGLDFCITTLLVVSAFTRFIAELIECFHNLTNKMTCSDEEELNSSSDDEDEDEDEDDYDDVLIEWLFCSFNVDLSFKEQVYDACDYVISGPKAKY